MNTADRRRILKSVNDLIDSVTALVDSMSQVAPKAGRAPKGARGGVRGEWTAQRRAKLKRSISSYWSRLTPEQHEARVRKMLAGRGLKPKPARNEK
jgi:hypothetical protein